MSKCRTIKQWPDNNEPAQFMELCNCVREALEFAYELKRANASKSVPWNGPPIGKSLAAASLDYVEALSAESLEWVLEDQGRDALEVIIGIAIQLGIEQGRRDYLTSNAYTHLLEKMEAIHRLSFRG